MVFHFYSVSRFLSSSVNEDWHWQGRPAGQSSNGRRRVTFARLGRTTPFPQCRHKNRGIVDAIISCLCSYAARQEWTPHTISIRFLRAGSSSSLLGFFLQSHSSLGSSKPQPCLERKTREVKKGKMKNARVDCVFALNFLPNHLVISARRKVKDYPP